MSELPDNPRDEGWRWFAFARDDLDAARVVLEREDLAWRVACFLAQQAAEKALKSVLVSQNLPVPRIHDLVEIAAALPVEPEGIGQVDLAVFEPWPGDGRYPSDYPDATRELAERLVRAAGCVIESVEPLLDPDRDGTER